MTIFTEHMWPEDESAAESGGVTPLPLPALEYSGFARNTSIASPLEHSAIARRRRYTKSYGGMRVVWRLNPIQLESFREFFEVVLGMGTACFQIHLRYPKNSALDLWVVRFIGGYEVTDLDGAWQVTAELDIIDKAELPEPAVRIGLHQLFVQSELGGVEELVTSDGHLLYVEE